MQVHLAEVHEVKFVYHYQGHRVKMKVSRAKQRARFDLKAIL